MAKSPNPTRATSVRPSRCMVGTTPSEQRVAALKTAVGGSGSASSLLIAVDAADGGGAVGVDETLRDGEAVVCQRLAVAGEACCRGDDVRVVADVGDPTVPVSDEVRHGLVGRLLVVDADDVRVQPARRAVDEDERAGPRSASQEWSPAVGTTRSPETRRRSSSVEDAELTVLIAVRRRDEDGSSLLRPGVLDRLDQGGEERVRDRLDDEPDGGVRSASQGPGHQVGGVAEILHDACTRSRVAAATRGSSLRTLDAVRRLTPAVVATSRRMLRSLLMSSP